MRVYILHIKFNDKSTVCVYYAYLNCVSFSYAFHLRSIYYYTWMFTKLTLKTDQVSFITLTIYHNH